MTTKVTIVLFLIAVASGSLYAQTNTDIFYSLEAKKASQGSIRIIQDANIRNLTNLHLSQQRTLDGIKGFKILIYMGSGQEAKKEAELARSRFISKYESVRCDRKFEYPYWKVYVGAFRIKSEALLFLNKIKNDYPGEAFIREDIIAFPN